MQILQGTLKFMILRILVAMDAQYAFGLNQVTISLSPVWIKQHDWAHNSRTRLKEIGKVSITLYQGGAKVPDKKIERWHQIVKVVESRT